MCSILLGLILLIIAGFLLAPLVPYVLMGFVILFMVLVVIYAAMSDKRRNG